MAGRGKPEDDEALRGKLLELLAGTSREMSPGELARELGVSISRTRFHLAVLATAGEVWVVRSQRAGEASIPFYRPR